MKDGEIKEKALHGIREFRKWFKDASNRKVISGEIPYVEWVLSRRCCK
jgi:hypothetical protein